MGSKRRRAALLAPIYIFTVIFVFLPVIYLIFLSFTTRAKTWGIDLSFTLKNYADILEGAYISSFAESLKMAFVTTLFTSFIGYPYAYFMARLSGRWKSVMMSLLMIPFWVSELIRLRGWTVLFAANGPLDRLLMWMGITDEPLKLLYSRPIVAFGMIYALLPFMILCVYSSVEKTDWRLVEASRDLGAGRMAAFWDVVFVQSFPGFLSGIILTFVPSMGLFYISDILGGNKIVLVGSLIEQEATKGRNIPLAAALSVVLVVFTSVFILLYGVITKRSEPEGVV